MEPVAKRIRRIAGIGGVTDTALLRIFSTLRDDPGLVDEVSIQVSSRGHLSCILLSSNASAGDLVVVQVRSRRSIQRAIMQGLEEVVEIEQVATPDGPFTWSRTNASALLQTFTSKSDVLALLFREKLQVSPSTLATPWRCILF